MAAKFISCSIDGCKANAHHSADGRRGWCNNHYYRWRVHGDPLGGRASPGEPERFFREVVLPHKGDDCIAWPYSKSPGGYGQLWDGSRMKVVTRLVCEEIHGPPPTSKHEAAHSCGKGHLGCCSPKHLSWKTPIENAADKIIHGTNARGERHGASKLSDAEAIEIMALKGKLLQREIADRFGVSVLLVSLIQSGKVRSHLFAEGR